MYNMILKYITKFLKLFFSLLFATYIQRFRIIYDKKAHNFSSNKLIKLLKYKLNNKKLWF